MDDDSQMRTERIYLDYNASTPVDPRVMDAMEPFWNKRYGNAGGLHREGVDARNALDASRSSIAENIAAQKDELIFTGSGTESNNIAIYGVVKYQLLEKRRPYSDMHFITSAVEHPSALDCFKELEQFGASVTYVGVDEEGRVDPREVREAITEKTVLISVMLVNNEVGTIHPLGEISKAVRDYRGNDRQYPYIHTDASQGVLYLPLSVQKLGVDLLTIDAQKIYGPKGVGGLFHKRGVEIAPLMIGGNQESGLRPGTENIPLIVGFKEAMKLAVADRETETNRVQILRDLFIETLSKEVPEAILNGGRENRIANNVNVSLPGMDNEYLVILLDAQGIACGTRSACIRSGGKSSYVIKAIYGDEGRATSSLRFTLGKHNTKEDILGAVAALREVRAANFDK